MKRGNASKNGKKSAGTPVSKDPKVFEIAFQKRLGQSPTDYLIQKIQGGSPISSFAYLFSPSDRYVVRSAQEAEQNGGGSLGGTGLYDHERIRRHHRLAL